jgi:hypothetical protein
MILYNPTVSGSLLVTGSLTTTGTITSQTLVVQTITSSIEFNTGSTRNGTLSTNTHEFTGSVSITGSGTATKLIVASDANAGTIDFGTGIYKGIMDYSAGSGLWRLNNQSAGAASTLYYQFQSDGTASMSILKNGNVGIGISNPSYSLDISAKTDSILLPVGTTAQRPTVANGLVRYNTDLQSLEAYITNNWVSLQTSANNGYGWRRPSTINIGGVLADGDRTWYSEINTANPYGAVVLNHIFTGNFTVVASWQRDYMGIGMIYKSGATLLDFNGYSVDPTGPYFGGAGTSGFSVGTYNSYNYLGRYPAPNGTGELAGTKYFFKWQRSGNSLTMQYSTTGPWGGWTNFGAGASATCSSGDSVIVGAGEASGTENDPLRLLYVIGN